MVSSDTGSVQLDLLRARSVADLRSHGSFHAVRRQVLAQMGGTLQIRARGWNQLLEGVLALQELSRGVGTVAREGDGVYFVSPAAEYIYALVELDGQARLDKLGVNIRLYRDADLARAWRDHVARQIHPDRCPHPNAARAMARLNELSASMTGELLAFREERRLSTATAGAR